LSTWRSMPRKASTGPARPGKVCETSVSAIIVARLPSRSGPYGRP
jgi:hypothetical protein